MMSLKNLGSNLGPLVPTLFVLYLYVLKSPVPVFLRLTFLQQQGSNLKLVKSF